MRKALKGSISIKDTLRSKIEDEESSENEHQPQKLSGFDFDQFGAQAVSKPADPELFSFMAPNTSAP